MSERIRRNVVVSRGLMKRMEDTKEEVSKRYYQKKYWIFWRIARWYYKRKEREDRYWKDFGRYQLFKFIATIGYVIFLIGFLYYIRVL